MKVTRILSIGPYAIESEIRKEQKLFVVATYILFAVVRTVFFANVPE